MRKSFVAAAAAAAGPNDDDGGGDGHSGSIGHAQIHASNVLLHTYDTRVYLQFGAMEHIEFIVRTVSNR